MGRGVGKSPAGVRSRLTEAMDAALRERAIREGRGINDVVRDALEAYLATPPGQPRPDAGDGRHVHPAGTVAS